MKFDPLARMEYICFITIAHPMQPQLPQPTRHSSSATRPEKGCPMSRFWDMRITEVGPAIDKAPTARPIPAQANGLGYGSNKRSEG